MPRPRARLVRRAAVRRLLGALCAIALLVGASATFNVLDCHDGAVVGTMVGAGVPGNREGRFEKSFLSSPAGVACSNATCYVSEMGNHDVKVIDLSKSEMRAFAGNGTSGSTNGRALASAGSSETQALFNQPRGLALVSNGHVMVVDSGNKAIRLIADGSVTTLISSMSFAPTALAYDENSGFAYVVGESIHSVMKLDVSQGTLTLYAGSQSTPGFVDHSTASSARFSSPEGLALDSTNSKLYIADTGNHAVRVVDLSTGAVATVLGDGTISSSGTTLNSDGVLATPARFNYPAGIAYNYDSTLSSGVLLVADRGTHQLRKIILSDSTASNAATVVTVAGSYTGTAGFKDNTVGNAALFNTPVSVAFVDGKTYAVADKNNHAVRKVRLEAPVDITFVMQAVANIEKTAESHDLVIEEYGAYSIDGPPYNETTSFSGILTYFGEVHEVTMCAYPSVDYFVRFDGAMQATVKDSSNYLYIGYTGATAEDTLSRTFRIRGPGCTDSSAPNYNPYATSDDGSCVQGIRLLFTVGAYGVIDHSVYEFEGPGLYVSDEFESGSGEAGYEQSIDFEFVAYPGAVYVANLYGALNASLTTVSGQSGLGANAIQYWSYSSSQATDQAMKRVRIIGPGCIDPSYATYDQYAIESDEVNACLFGGVLRVILNASSAAESWYDYGSIVGTSVYTAELYGISLDNATDQLVADIFITPGVYEFESYGDVSVAVQRFVTSSYTDLATWTGTNSSLSTDAYGFTSTVGSERVVVAFPAESSIVIGLNGVVGYAGGVLIGNDSESTVTFAEGAVPWLSSITSTFTQLTSSSLLKNSLWYNENINILGVSPYMMVLTPKGYTFSVSSQLVLSYENTAVPSQEGNENIILFRASDSTVHDPRALDGASFDTSNGRATASIDSTGTYGVAFRATVRSISPPRGWIDGGVTVKLDGVDFSSLSTVNTPTTYQKCRWGDSFTSATTVASSDIRSTLSGSDSTVMGAKLNAVSCLSPAKTRAGFTIVEFHDSKNGMTSDTKLVYLQTMSPKIQSVIPSEGVVSGGTIVSLYGKYLRSGAFTSGGEMFDRDTTFFAHAGPIPMPCVFGSATSSGVAVSSAVARCESPSTTSTTSVTMRLGDLMYDSTGGYDEYTYVSNFDTSISSTAYSDDSGDSSFTDGGVIVQLRSAVGSLSKQRIIFNDWRCLFGAVSVDSRRDAYGDLSCVSTSIVRGDTVDVRLVGAHGEASLLLGNISASTISSTYVDSIVALPGTVQNIETISVLERANSPMFWEPFKWVRTAHALVSPPGGAWYGTGQGFGHGIYGDANCTFTTDAGVATTSVAIIISSVLVVCEMPSVSSTSWANVVVSSAGVYSGSPRTSLTPWFVTDDRQEVAIDPSYAWYTWEPGVWPTEPSGVSLFCYFGDTMEPLPYESNLVGCIPPHSSSPGFIAVALDLASVTPKFYHQVELREPMRAAAVSPKVLSASGGSVVYIVGKDLYAGTDDALVYCGFMFVNLESYEVTYVSSALLKCETTPSSNTTTNSEMTLAVGTYDELTGTEQSELSLSPADATIRGLFNAFGVRTIVTPTVTSTSPVASTARGGAVFSVNGTSFAAETGESRCVFGSIYVSATVYNSTYADCVTPALVPAQTYSVSFSVVGSAAQSLLDVDYAYANGTAISHTPY